MGKRNKQGEAVLQYIRKKGELTRYQAHNELGILNVGDVVLRLRRKGYNIITENIPVVNRYGTKTRYGIYRLKEEKKELSTKDN